VFVSATRDGRPAKLVRALSGDLVGWFQNFSWRTASFQHVLLLPLKSDRDVHLGKVEADFLLLLPINEVFVTL
jgi:hypothetical protein